MNKEEFHRFVSADSAPSKALWGQLSALYRSCGIVSVTCVMIYSICRKVEVNRRWIRVLIYRLI